MIVYVETNFLLELAYLQERCESCQAIIDLGVSGAITLALPAVSAAEARATWHRRAAERREFHSALQKHIRQISRSEPFRGLVDRSRDVVAALIEGSDESQDRLEGVINTFTHMGSIIPLDGDVVVMARAHEVAYSLTPPDAAVLASIRAHAEGNAGPKMFISQDAKGFAHPDIIDDLAALDCRVLVNFTDALAYLRNALRPRA